MTRALAPLVLCLLIASPAGAVEHDVHAWADYFRGTDQAATASRLLAHHLAVAPTDLRAQRAYIQLQVWEFGEGVFVERQYRDWLAEDPDQPVRRAALASALHAIHPRRGPWCAEADALLGSPPQGVEDRYQALLIRSGVARTCDLSDPGLGAATEAAGRAAQAGLEATLRARLARDPLTPRVLAELRRTWKRTPAAMVVAVTLWDREDEAEPAASALLQARSEALAAARKLARSEDPVRAWWTWQVLGRAGDDGEQQALAAHIVALDPNASPGRWLVDASSRAVREAAQVPDPEVALAALDALGSQLPEDGPLRQQLELARRSILRLLGRPDDAYLALRGAWRADPTSPSMANEWAWSAAQRGEDLPEALLASEAALQALDARAYSGEAARGGDPSLLPFDAWAQRQAAIRSAALDTKAWVLHGLDRNDEAAVVMRQALLLASNPVNHLHMAFIEEARGHLPEAVEHLLIGLSFPDVGDTTLAIAARALLGTIGWDARPQWHPQGLAGLLATRAAVRQGAAAPAEGHASPLVATHPLVGQPFPDLEVTIGGARRRLSELAGPLVIDLWATWCAPCLEALPHVQDLALQHAGAVTFVALSVDEEPSDVTGFFADAPPPAYTVAWYGRDAYAAAGIQGIPSAFVLDADHRVTAYVRGYGGPDDHRLAEAITSLLDQ